MLKISLSSLLGNLILPRLISEPLGLGTKKIDYFLELRITCENIKFARIVKQKEMIDVPTYIGLKQSKFTKIVCNS
jgi:hypothetical protein